MIVVPGLPEGRQGQPEDVGGVIVHVESAGADEVADRVDAPGDVVDEEDADQPAPEKAGGGTEQGAGDQVAGEGWDRQAGSVSQAKRRVIKRIPRSS